MCLTSPCGFDQGESWLPCVFVKQQQVHLTSLHIDASFTAPPSTQSCPCSPGEQWDKCWFCLPSLLLRMYLELISYWPVWTKGMITASKSCFSVQMYEQFTQQWKTSHPHGPQNISRASPKQLIASWKVKWLHTACLASSQSIEGLRDVLMAWDPRLIRKDIFYTLYNHSNLCTHFRWGNALSLAATVKEEGVNALKRV